MRSGMPEHGSMLQLQMCCCLFGVSAHRRSGLTSSSPALRPVVDLEGAGAVDAAHAAGAGGCRGYLPAQRPGAAVAPAWCACIKDIITRQRGIGCKSCRYRPGSALA